MISVRKRNQRIKSDGPPIPACHVWYRNVLIGKASSFVQSRISRDITVTVVLDPTPGHISYPVFESPSASYGVNRNSYSCVLPNESSENRPASLVVR